MRIVSNRDFEIDEFDFTFLGKFSLKGFIQSKDWRFAPLTFDCRLYAFFHYRSA